MPILSDPRKNPLNFNQHDHREEQRHHNAEVELTKSVDALAHAVGHLTVAVEGSTKRVLDIRATVFHARRRPIMQMPPIQLFDSEKVLLHSSPKLPNGDLDTKVVVTWVSDTPDQVTLEPVDPLGRDCWALTPLDNGAATVTATAPGYNPSTQPISYALGQPRELNLSSDAPVSDLP